MRYDNQKIVDFKNVLGETRKVFTPRLSKVGEITGVYTKPKEMDFDNVMILLQGANSEIETFKLRDQNVVQLLNYEYDESKISLVDLF